jgi:uncharacterized protein YdaU (DUF1376 family)
MSKVPSMPFLVDKYLADTEHLSLEEHGAYCLLLFRMWQRGGSLADNDADLARLLGVTPKAWKRLRERLGPFFESHGGLLMQKRLQKQWNYAVEHSAQAKAKASFAAKRRWEKAKGLETINSVLQAMPQAMPRVSPKQCPSDAILKKEDIPLPLSNTVAPEEGSEQEPSARISRLLQTNLMKRSSAA